LIDEVDVRIEREAAEHGSDVSGKLHGRVVLVEGVATVAPRQSRELHRHRNLVRRGNGGTNRLERECQVQRVRLLESGTLGEKDAGSERERGGSERNLTPQLELRVDLPLGDGEEELRCLRRGLGPTAGRAKREQSLVSRHQRLFAQRFAKGAGWTLVT